MNTNSIVLTLVQNAALLLAMTLIFDVTLANWQAEKFSIRQVLVGIVIGGIGIALMMTSWEFAPGIIFDTRSILLSVSGLFFGFVPALIAILMTAAFRVIQGGAMLTGISVIIATGLMGVIWRNFLKTNLTHTSFWKLYLFGVANHLVMLLLMLTLPIETALSVLRTITLPILIIYPIATALLGELMAGRLRRQQLAIDLQESQERLHLAVTAGNVGFFERNFQTGVVHFSKEWKSQLGYPVDELSDKTSEWERRVHPDDLPHVQKKIEALVDGAATLYEAQYRLQHKDGSYRWILARGEVQKDHHNKPLKLVGCHIDITDLKETEAALHTSREQYRVLTENIKDVVWILDAETYRFTYMSPSCERLRGYTVEETLALPLDYAITQKQGEWVKNLIQQRKTQFIQGEFGSDHYFTTEVEQSCKDGSTVWTDVITNYYINQQTGHVEVLGVTHDVSERHEAQEKIRRLNEELEQRVRERTAQLQTTNEELEAFAYSVSHDLRAPLRAINGFSAALQESYQHLLDEQGQHYFSRIQEAAKRMGELIDDLLMLSRVTRSDFTPGTVDLSALAQAIAAQLQHDHPARDLQIKVEPGMNSTADPRLIRIVIENLLNNAVKFSADKSPAQITFGTCQQDGTLAYFVQDNGVGFDMAYADKLFVPFQRLHSSREFPGIGVGLVTVKRIITRHSGRIWTEAAPNTGATFYFTLGENHA